MANEDISRQIFESIDTIIAERLKNLKQDTTGVYKVIAQNANTPYLYTVSDGTNTFEARGINQKENFLVGQRVYVTIPQGDMNKEKIIIGGYIEDQMPQYLYSDPFTNMRWESKIGYKNNNDPWYVLSIKPHSDGVATNNFNSENNYDEDKFDNNNVIHEDGETVQPQYFRDDLIITPSGFDQYSYFGVEFSINANLPKVNVGDYCIEFQFLDKDNNLLHPAEPLMLYGRDIPGNPYYSIKFLPYRYVFPFPRSAEVEKIQKIKIIMHQSGNFNEDQFTFGERISFILHNMYLGQNVDTIPASGYATLVADAASYGNNNNDITLRATWVHDKEIFNSNFPWDENHPTISNAKVYIEQYDLNNANNVNGWVDLNQAGYTIGVGTGTCLRLDRAEEKFRTRVTFDYTYTNLDGKAITDKKEYISETLVLENKNYDVTEVVLGNQSSLEIVAPLGFNHYVYDTNGTYSQANGKEYSLCAKRKDNDINEQLEEGDIVRWIIPLQGTMIQTLATISNSNKDNNSFWIDTKVEKDESTDISNEKYHLKYKIKKNYNPSSLNNEVRCEVIRNNNIIDRGKATLYFGMGDTQGTGYKFNLKIKEGTGPVLGLYQGVTVEAELFDPDGNKVELSDNDDTTIEWSWYSKAEFLNPQDLRDWSPDTMTHEQQPSLGSPGWLAQANLEVEENGTTITKYTNFATLPQSSRTKDGIKATIQFSGYNALRWANKHYVQKEIIGEAANKHSGTKDFNWFINNNVYPYTVAYESKDDYDYNPYLKLISARPNCAISWDELNSWLGNESALTGRFLTSLSIMKGIYETEANSQYDASTARLFENLYNVINAKKTNASTNSREYNDIKKYIINGKMYYAKKLHNFMINAWSTYDMSWNYVLKATIHNVRMPVQTEGNLIENSSSSKTPRTVNLTALLPIPLVLHDDQGYCFTLIDSTTQSSRIDVPSKELTYQFHNEESAYVNMSMNNGYADAIQGPTQIIYNSTGTNPQYVDEPYRMHVGDSWKDLSNKDNSNGYCWKIRTNVAPDADQFTTERFELQETVITDKDNSSIVITDSVLSFDKYETKLKVPDTVLTLMPFGCVMGRWGASRWYQPLLITRDNYSYELLNQWSGQTYITKNAVLSQFMAAGTMDNMNSFTGVMLGSMEVANAQVGADRSIANGLIGMKNGNLTYYLSTDGDYYFGDGNNGYIKFDGSGLGIKTTKILIDVKPLSNQIGNFFYINSTPAYSGEYDSWIAAGDKKKNNDTNFYNDRKFWIAKDGILHAKGAILEGSSFKDNNGDSQYFLQYKTVTDEEGNVYYELGDGTKISAEGALVADNAIIRGTVYAGAGYIGGLDIKNQKVYSANYWQNDSDKKWAGYTAGMNPHYEHRTGNNIFLWAGANNKLDSREKIRDWTNIFGEINWNPTSGTLPEDWEYGSGARDAILNTANFYVTYDGILHAKGAVLSGNTKAVDSEGNEYDIITQFSTLAGLTLSVTTENNVSYIQLSSNGINIGSSAKIEITGEVVFKSDLSSKDSGTTIHGSNIQTGTLSANKITTGILNASKVTISNLSVGDLTYGSIAPNSDLGGLWTILRTSIRAESTLPDTNYTRYTHLTPTRLIYNSKSDGTIINTDKESILWSDIITKVNALSPPSDERIKKDIETLSDNYEIFFDLLQPKRYKYIDGTSDRYHTGYIAQEVVEALQQSKLDTQQFAAVMLQHPGEFDECWHLRRDEFVALNTWQIQKLKARVADLEAKLAALE